MALGGSSDMVLKELEQVLQCWKCKTKCETPRVLPCYHLFCESCVPFDEYSNIGKCPSCNESSGTANIRLGGFLSTIKSEAAAYVANPEEKTQLCCTCKEQNAENRCYECKKFMCKKCTNIHNTFGLNHHVTSISESNESLPFRHFLQNRGTKCPKHEANSTFFCHDCRTYVCATCSVIDHRLHRVQNIEDIATAKRSELSNVSIEIVSSIEQRKETMAFLENSSRTLEDTKEEVKLEIKHFAEVLHDTIQAKERGMLEYLEKIYEENTQNIAQKLESQKSTIEKSVGLQLYVHCLESFANHSEILDETSVLFDQWERVKSSCPEEEQNIVGKFTFNENRSILPNINQDDIGTISSILNSDENSGYVIMYDPPPTDSPRMSRPNKPPPPPPTIKTPTKKSSFDTPPPLPLRKSSQQELSTRNNVTLTPLVRSMTLPIPLMPERRVKERASPLGSPGKLRSVSHCGSTHSLDSFRADIFAERDFGKRCSSIPSLIEESGKHDKLCKIELGIKITGLTVCSNGNILVVVENKCLMCSSNGRLLKEVKENLLRPFDAFAIAYDRGEYIFISERGKITSDNPVKVPSVKIFDDKGTFVSVFTREVTAPRGITATTDRVYVCDVLEHSLKIFGVDGRLLRAVARSSQRDLFLEPLYITLIGSDLIISDYRLMSLLVLDENGSFRYRIPAVCENKRFRPGKCSITEGGTLLIGNSDGRNMFILGANKELWNADGFEDSKGAPTVLASDAKGCLWIGYATGRLARFQLNTDILNGYGDWVYTFGKKVNISN